jgi:hypothetical protein
MNCKFFFIFQPKTALGAEGAAFLGLVLCIEIIFFYRVNRETNLPLLAKFRFYPMK